MTSENATTKVMKNDKFKQFENVYRKNTKERKRNTTRI